jgi:hypothetical protein
MSKKEDRKLETWFYTIYIGGQVIPIIYYMIKY